MKQLVISDLHIGSSFYREKELFEFLELNKHEYDELILAGDIIDFIKIPLFSRKGIRILEILKDYPRVIWIVGNHDISLKKLIGEKISNVEFAESYEFIQGGKKFRIEHGDVYDQSAFVKYETFMSLLSVVQDFFEKLFKYDIGTYWSNWQSKKRKVKRIWDILTWKDNDIDVLIIGHFHTPECIIWVNKDQVVKKYINCGDWQQNTTYVSIIDGEARLKKYESDSSHKLGNS